MYTTCLMVILPYAKTWCAYVKEQKHLARFKFIVKIYFWYWGHRSRSYRVHDCMWHIEPWWYTNCITKYDYAKGQKRWGLNKKSCHKPYKFDLKVKGQGHIRIMNVLDTSSLGDRPMCQIWYANVKANRSYKLDMKTWQKPIKLTWRSKVNIQSGSWMYTAHRLMVIHPCAKYGRPMSNQKQVMGRTRKHVKNIMNLT